jgi:hypothetical protein
MMGAVPNPSFDEVWQLSYRIPAWPYKSYTVRVVVPADKYGTLVVQVWSDGEKHFRRVHGKWFSSQVLSVR